MVRASTTFVLLILWMGMQFCAGPIGTIAGAGIGSAAGSRAAASKAEIMTRE
jgi:hypothetical protein